VIEQLTAPHIICLVDKRKEIKSSEIVRLTRAGGGVENREINIKTES